MPAAKGFRPPNAGRGRELGSKNKLSGQVKDMILAALDQVGGVDYLVKRAQDQPVAFMALLGRVLPLTVQNQPKPPEEMTDDELAAYIRAIKGYLTRAGVDPERIASAGGGKLGASGDPGGTRHTQH